MYLLHTSTLLLPLKWRTNTKLKWNRNLESVVKKKLLNIITSRFFLRIRETKRNPTKQYHACEKLMVNLLLVLKRLPSQLWSCLLPFYQAESLSIPVMMTLIRTPMITSQQIISKKSTGLNRSGTCLHKNANTDYSK